MQPKSEEDLSQMIIGANGPLRITGGGTRPIGHCDGDALSTAALSGISLYEPGALTIVAGAGTPIAEIEETLAAENQRLAFEPMDHRVLLGTKGTPTLGGMAAANVSGPRRISVGACRDFMLGVRFVDGQGTIIKNGGRVMKNVTGYDLVKLMAGSYGTLGVLTEVSLKVLPNVETTATLRLHGLTDRQAVQALSAALGSPFEATGAAHLPKGADGDPVTMLRIEGFEASIKYRAEKLQALLKPFGTVDVAWDDAATWTAIRDVTAFADQPGNVWRISAKPSAAPELVAKLDATAVQYDWGGGLIWALADEGRDLRAALGDFEGHATLVRGHAEVPAFHPELPALATLTNGLRAKFDPRGILNPGIMT
ncbi:2-hydroxy-acid oxidase [Loktanella sp. 5RATIMAR09]|uniref:FAD-binding protein n=1 Tax=Loktanella sp. 5RATIMAR09 TaxID=1225655 RepID=UPI0006EB5492|nr:FAD-binding protein [Loktanella sp. 5RATIMAR09]KQI72273.1 2-hydroxy-acid oxidase [Loktanella sp. 5RATIMAR09]